MEYPEWATKKQKDGMEDFYCIASEYIHDMKVEFLYNDCREEYHGFTAVASWGYGNDNEEVKSRSFDIAWDYEATWDRYGDRTQEWQFLFSGGDATREMTTEVFFLDLFFYLDEAIEAVVLLKQQKEVASANAKKYADRVVQLEKLVHILWNEVDENWVEYSYHTLDKGLPELLEDVLVNSKKLDQEFVEVVDKNLWDLT